MSEDSSSKIPPKSEAMSEDSSSEISPKSQAMSGGSSEIPPKLQAMSEGSSSQSSSKSERKREIKTLTRAGSIEKRIFGNEYVRSHYMKLYLKNPEASIEQNTTFEVYKYTKEDLYALKQMCDLSHRNILQCFKYKKITKNGLEYFEAEIEEYHGPLSYFLEQKFEVLTVVRYIPSRKFANIVRAIVEVLSFLHAKKLYHGNLSWKSLLYSIDDGGDPIVKLAHFARKEGVEILDAQINYWIALADMLQEVYNESRMQKTRHCIKQLTDAISFFRNVYDLSENQRRNICAEIQTLDFFWTRENRRNYAVKIYDWCFVHKEILEVETGIVNFPWDKFLRSKVGPGLIKSMNDFKDQDGSNTKGDYDVNKNIDFLKCVSGLYAHCGSIMYTPIGARKKIRGNLRVIDEFVCAEYPELFPKLRSLQEQYQF
ncbi:DNA mismatch repair protein Mlh1 [Rhynchospora pubera]|uniref:DNA mismatch repair protein Mlh1 n=1 Tax=Rhynchospora pubera TaxID=906938 RepID=A0AAV8HSX7_9POAL|nr:hypothetical protein LUZ62_078448 [Rhynchospora pubera]KAJ4820777.1 DNA mismatch repair protein Mlh1 [Rhynchospora pubera]